MNKIETSNSIIDQILEKYRGDLGKHYESYRNHVYRVYNFARPFVSGDRGLKILSMAAAFHDLGIWTHKTFDYLLPSMDLAKQYCTDKNMDTVMTDEILTMINLHHKITVVKTSALAEIFRQADLVDLTLGLVRKKRSRDLIRSAKKNFPNKGFHLNLTVLFFKELIRHPLKSLPMFKW